MKVLAGRQTCDAIGSEKDKKKWGNHDGRNLNDRAV